MNYFKILAITVFIAIQLAGCGANIVKNDVTEKIRHDTETRLLNFAKDFLPRHNVDITKIEAATIRGWELHLADPSSNEYLGILYLGVGNAVAGHPPQLDKDGPRSVAGQLVDAAGLKRPPKDITRAEFSQRLEAAGITNPKDTLGSSRVGDALGIAATTTSLVIGDLSGGLAMGGITLFINNGPEPNKVPHGYLWQNGYVIAGETGSLALASIFRKSQYTSRLVNPFRSNPSDIVRFYIELSKIVEGSAWFMPDTLGTDFPVVAYQGKIEFFVTPL